MTGDDRGLPRRRLLAAGAAGALGTLAGCGALPLGGDDTTTPFERRTDDGDGGDGAARALAERFAPALRFGRYERWYPTDPRRYATDPDGRVVDGFAALDGYTRDRREGGFPAATVFYNVLSLPDSALSVVQYWMYSVFDQFAVNFHWHDWELLQVFVDTDADRAVLLDASAHARTVPNNEYLVGEDEDVRVGVLSEVGSHSSTTAVNARETTFQRLPLDGVPPDVTNAALDLADVLGLPVAYGLPRDEGGVLPYVMPELDGRPLYEHPDLPNVREDDLVPPPLTVRSLADLTAPPEDVPRREHATTLVAASDDRDGDGTYDLVDVSEVEHVEAFEGPQLSFEFAIPGFVEDRFASHLTSTGVPWNQPRFTDPLADVTDRRHREFLRERYLEQQAGVARAAPTARTAQAAPNALVAAVEEVRDGADGTLRAAPEGARDVFGDRVAVSVHAPRVESVVRVDGEDPTAVPTVGGVARFVDVPAGDRQVVVNGAGYAPYAERVEHGGGLSTPGAGGRIGVVARENATKVRGELDDVERVRVDEDFAGRLLDVRPVEDDRFGVYLHRRGAYSLEIRNRDGGVGVFRVTGDDRDDATGTDDDTDERRTTATTTTATTTDGRGGADPPGVRTVDARTGKEPIAEYLGAFLADAVEQARVAERDPDRPESVTRGFEGALNGARQAIDAVSENAPAQADRALERLRERLVALADRIERQRGDGVPEAGAAVLAERVGTADRRARQAIDQPL